MVSIMAPGLGGGERGAAAPKGNEDKAVVEPVPWGASVVTGGGGRGKAVGPWWA